VSSTPARARLTRFAWGVLAYNLAVILWGAFVRATGSGAGCGSHWPLCNGEIVPRSPSVETLIELSHRLTSGLALLLVVALWIGVFQRCERGHAARRWASLSVALMLFEAAIGAGLVLFELVAENESVARGLFMAVHLGNTFLLLATLTLTARATAGEPDFRLRRQGRFGGLVILALLATMLVGMSGAVAALGDTLYPATSLGEALRQDLSPTTSVLVQLRVLHPLLAVATSVLVLYLAARVRARGGRRDRRRAGRLSLLVYVQLGIGTINVLLLAPIAMQLLHLLVADLLWIALVLAAAGGLAAPRAGDAPAGG